MQEQWIFWLELQVAYQGGYKKIGEKVHTLPKLVLWRISMVFESRGRCGVEKTNMC